MKCPLTNKQTNRYDQWGIFAFVGLLGQQSGSVLMLVKNTNIG